MARRVEPDVAARRRATSIRARLKVWLRGSRRCRCLASTRVGATVVDTFTTSGFSMGWLFCKPTRDDLVQHLLGAHAGHLERVDHALVGNALWVLYRDKASSKTFILLFMLKGARGSAHDPWRWGYKDVDESMGPCDTSCPERLLAASCDDSEVAVAWRERCRAQHADRRQREQFVRNLKPGDLFAYGDCVYRHVRRSHNGRHPVGLNLETLETAALYSTGIRPLAADPRGDLRGTAALLTEEFTARFGKQERVILRMHSPAIGWIPFEPESESLSAVDTGEPVVLYATSPSVPHDRSLPQAPITLRLRTLKAMARASSDKTPKAA